MLLGRLEKDGSRKVGIYFDLPPLIPFVIVVFLYPLPLTCSLAMSFSSSFSASHSSSVTLCFCSMWEFQTVRQGQKPSFNTSPACFDIVPLLWIKKIHCFIAAFAFFSHSRCLQHIVQCDIWGSFIPLKFTTLYFSSHPHERHTVLTVWSESCESVTYILSIRRLQCIIVRLLCTTLLMAVSWIWVLWRQLKVIFHCILFNK